MAVKMEIIKLIKHKCSFIQEVIIRELCTLIPIGISTAEQQIMLLLTLEIFLSSLITEAKTTWLSVLCPTPIVFDIKLTQSVGEQFSDASLYRSTIGALQYLTISRLDIAYAVNKLSQYLSAPTTFHWLACKRVLRYIKGTLHCGLFFLPSSQLSLTAFTDANWGRCLDDKKSTSDVCILLGKHLVTWGVRK
ncbi:hypothetical protein ACOSQ3_019876 [Xanthoceras sorbifolium]